MSSNLLTLPADASPGVAHPPTNRVRAVLHDATYPVSDRTAETPGPEIPAPFHDLPGLIEASLLFHEEARAATTREALYDANERAYEALEQLQGETGQLAKDVFAAGLEVRGDWMTDKRKYEYMQGLTETWNRKLPTFAFERPPLLTLDLHAKPDFVVRAALLDGIRGCIHTLVKKLVLSLDCLTELEVVGLIQWLQPDACQYSFFRHVLTVAPGDVRESAREEVTDRGAVRERKRVTRVERDFVQTRSVARHVHDLICCRNYALAGATDVPMPDRVRHLIRKIPPFLGRFVRVVTGQEVRRLIIERDISTETTTDTEESVTVQEEHLYRPDPALVLGHYVLTGWDEDELRPQSLPGIVKHRPVPAIGTSSRRLPAGDNA
jgi:hypothetical protein